MRKAIIALAASASLAAAMVPGTADAHCRGCAVGAGIAGGLAVGALIGAAAAAPRPYYYEPAPVYVAPPPEYVEGPICHVERHRYWDGYGYRWRRVQVCE